MQGTVLSIERCSLHDGPGLRTTVFLKGCPLKCLWCHNPESKSFKPELFYFAERCGLCGLCATICPNHKVNTEHIVDHNKCTACAKCVKTCPASAFEIKGTVMTAEEVLAEVLKDVRYYEKSGGGMTISGGEPLAQAEFTTEILRLAKENNIHTCIETSGHASLQKISAVAPYVDLWLFDFKAGEEEHEEFTGVSRELIDRALDYADGFCHATGAGIVLRCPVVPTCNDHAAHFTAIAQTANRLHSIREINVMPYHPMGESKANRIGHDYPLKDIGFPEEETVQGWIQEIQAQTSIPVLKG